MTRKSLTQTAHSLVAEVLQPGEIAIDATAGNGHDTLFLAEHLGENGTVYAFDVQADAIAATTNRLSAVLRSRVRLKQLDHAEMFETIAPEHQGHIGAVMFNLGYLPGGDKTVITSVDSTLAAIRSSLELLRGGGILTVLAYPGHSGGDIETSAVESLFRELDSQNFQCEQILSGADRADSPRLFVVRKSVPESAAPDKSRTGD